MTAVMDQKYVDEVKAVLLGHREWARTGRGRPADVSFWDLSGLNLTKVNLRQAKLVGAGMSRTKLIEANFEQADLFSADLEGADLTRANLLGADLRGANLHAAVLAHANLTGVDLSNGEIFEMGDGEKTDRLERKRFKRPSDAFNPNAELIDADLTGAIMVESRLQNADFTGADLSSADLAGADLTNSVLVGASLVDANLENVQAKGAQLVGAAMSGDALEQLRAQGADQGDDWRNVSKDFLHMVDQHFLFVASGGEDGGRLDLDRVRFNDGALSGCGGPISPAAIFRTRG